MITGWIWELVIHFILGQLAGATGAIDWTGLRNAYDAHLAAILPHWLAVPATAAANAAFGAAQLALSDQADLAKILAAVAAGDWQGAKSALEALILASVQPKP